MPTLSGGLRLATLVAAAWLFVASFSSPTLYLSRGSYVEPVAVLLFGWGYPAWYANFAVALALVLCRGAKARVAIASAIVTVVLALSTFAMLGRRVLTDEGGGTDTVASLGLGAYFWMGSMLGFAGYALLRARLSLSARGQVAGQAAAGEAVSNEV